MHLSMRISVVGLGKLGAPLAAVLADHGHEVVGVDSHVRPVELLNAGHPPVEEPDLAAVIARSRQRLSATSDLPAAVAATELTFIIVPTPSLESGPFSNHLVLDTIRGIGEGLRRRSAYHLVVVTSTVMPGSMEGEIRPALERASGRNVGESVGLCYNPEFVALGSVLRDMTNPDFVLIGESDARAGDTLTSVHRTLVGANTTIRRMNFVNAEIAKIAVNTFVTAKISFANMLAEVCEQFPGGDVDVVTGAIGHDTRIGHRYFRGALGYGGPCFPRDNIAFAALASSRGVRAELAIASDQVNRHQIQRLDRLVRSQVGAGRSRVGILGLSYKPDTPIAEESQGVMLANSLARAGLAVLVYDPQALSSAAPLLDPAIVRAQSVEEVVRTADVVVITTPWPSFLEIPQLLVGRPGPRPTIVDCWRMLDGERVAGRAELLYMGQAPLHAAVATSRAGGIDS
jgi:UDPglucose 6-dehydrogenase